MRTKRFSKNGSPKTDAEYEAEIARLLELPLPNGGNGRRGKRKASPKKRMARSESSTGVESIHDAGALARPSRCSERATRRTGVEGIPDAGASPRPSRCSERATPDVAECASIQPGPLNDRVTSDGAERPIVQPTPLNAGAFSYTSGWMTMVVTPALNGGNGGMRFVIPGDVGQSDARRVVYVALGGAERGEIEVVDENAREGEAKGAAPLTSCAAPCAAPDAASERDTKGRFVKGNKGGPGNPFNRRLAAMRKALCKAVTADDIRVLTATMLAKAREGDMAATKLLLLYAIGRPTEVVDPDRLDHEEWSLFKESALPEDYLEITRRLPPWHLCTLFRAAGPGLAEGWNHMLHERFQAQPPGETAKTAGEGAKR